MHDGTYYKVISCQSAGLLLFSEFFMKSHLAPSAVLEYSCYVQTCLFFLSPRQSLSIFRLADIVLTERVNFRRYISFIHSFAVWILATLDSTDSA